MGQPSEAEALVLRMEDEGLEPDDATFPEILQAWARQGNFVRAEKLLQRVELRDCNPSEKVYHSFISVCSPAHDQKVNLNKVPPFKCCIQAVT